MITTRELRLLNIIQMLRAGNPNHDPSTGKFSAGGGAGHHARKKSRRRKRKKRALESLRKDTHETIADLRLTHRAERKELNKLNRQGWKQLKREQARDRKTFMKDEKKDWRDFKREKPDREARNDWRAQHRESKENLREQQKDERKDYKESSHQDHANLTQEHRENFARVREDFQEELATIGKRRKTARDLHSLPEVGPFSLRRKLVISPGRTHKASSAESILRHCLRSLGFTAAYKRGELTGDQHLELLEAVRLYGRAWLRHEAETFARHYLSQAEPRSNERIGVVASGAIRGRLSASDARGVPETQGRSESGVHQTDGHGPEDVDEEGIFRASWVEGPDGFLILQEKVGLGQHFRRFFGRVKQFVRETIVAGVMSLLGPAPLTGEELEAAEKAAQVQDQFFDRFHDEMLKNPPSKRPVPQPIDPNKTVIIDLVPPPITLGQFVARVEKYADSTWHQAMNANRQAAIAQGQFKFERRVLGQPKTEHCEDCPPIATKGWQPIGTLPAIGDTECGPLCLCSFRFSDVSKGNGFIQGKKGPVPAPVEAVMLEDDDEVHMIAEPPGKPLNVPIAGPPR